MTILACTGGIGSGKSYSGRIFAKLGVPVYFADTETKNLYLTDMQLQRDLGELLGMDIVVEGVLQREKMAARIFSDSEMLKEVNRLVHPRVLVDFSEWRERRGVEGYGVVMFESAILFEVPIFREVADRIIVVTAPLNVRIERVMKRDSLSEEMVMERIKRQPDDEFMMAKADYIIFADGKRAVLPQIVKIMESVRSDG